MHHHQLTGILATYLKRNWGPISRDTEGHTVTLEIARCRKFAIFLLFEYPTYDFGPNYYKGIIEGHIGIEIMGTYIPTRQMRDLNLPRFTLLNIASPHFFDEIDHIVVTYGEEAERFLPSLGQHWPTYDVVRHKYA